LPGFSVFPCFLFFLDNTIYSRFIRYTVSVGTGFSRPVFIPTPLLGATITAVRNVAQGARTRVFQRQGQLLPAACGDAFGTPKFAWYGASTEDVAVVVDCGFARTNASRLGARKHGDDLHLCRRSAPTRGEFQTCSRVSIQSNIEFSILIHSRLISCSKIDRVASI
jgi:hypothetical protein